MSVKVVPGGSDPSIVTPAASDGQGWECLVGDDQIRELAGLDAEKLRALAESQRRACAGNAFGVTLIRHGRLAAELDSIDSFWGNRFDVHSCTKSFTSLAWGILLDDRRLIGDPIDLDTPIHTMFPAAGRPTDDRLERITLRHILSMTSGLPGEQSGLWAQIVDAADGPYEFALGLSPNRFGQWAKPMVAEPGARWDYSDVAFARASLAFAHVSGREMADFVDERILQPIGAGPAFWDAHGGEGHIGPHTAAVTGLHITARDLARVGLLLLRGGLWASKVVVPGSWIEQATVPSQPMNPAYGLGFWTNAEAAYLPHAPRDMFLMAGYRSNRCYVIPSLDLVIARAGSGPLSWDEPGFMAGILDAIL